MYNLDMHKIICAQRVQSLMFHCPSMHCIVVCILHQIKIDGLTLSLIMDRVTRKDHHEERNTWNRLWVMDSSIYNITNPIVFVVSQSQVEATSNSLPCQNALCFSPIGQADAAILWYTSAMIMKGRPHESVSRHSCRWRYPRSPRTLPLSSS